MENKFDISKHKTVQQVAKELGYTPANVTRMIRAGELKAVKRGRRYFIPIESVEALVVDPSLEDNPFFS